MASQQGDIRKMGTLKKLKTMKKKFFILREESDGGPARLEYHDSEKKFRNNCPPKRSIELELCFNINKKSDTKHKHAIALYTKDDCFAFVCESEEDQEEWLKLLLELQNCHAEDGEPPKPLFEHIWQVTVKPKGLANSKSLAGVYRLCLTDKTLSLIRINTDTADTAFQLPSIRRCGHTDCFFFMEVGRSAVTGPGEMWMQVEDTVIAQNMHEAILSAMKSTSSTAEPQPFMRPRSRSGGSKPIMVPRSRGGSPSRSSESHPPKRSKTISEGQCGSSPRRTRVAANKASTMRPNSMHPGLGSRGHSPALSSSPLSFPLADQHAHRLRSDSLESRGSRGTNSSVSVDEDMSPSDCLHSSVVSEDGNHFLSPNSKENLGKSPESNPKLGPGYMEMSPVSSAPGPSGGRNSSYMAMSPVAHPDVMDIYSDMAVNSFSTSPAVSTTSSLDFPDDRGYLDMTPLGQSLPTVEEKSSAEGYMDMSVSHSSSPATMLLRPEKVYSYLSDDSGTATPDDFPKRAYSVGSKPVMTKGKPRNASLCEPDAHNLDKSVGKCNSAPHLPEDDVNAKHTSAKLSNSSLHRNSSQKSMSEENSNFLMEMTFSRCFRSDSESRGSQSSLGSCRSRNSSISNDMRPRTASFGAEMRPRTSSINNADMRPRSASQGQKTSRFFKRFSRDKERSSSSDSLKKMSFGLTKKTLHEVGSPKKAEPQPMQTDDNVYFEINSSKEDVKNDGYSYIDITPEVKHSAPDVSMSSGQSLMPPFLPAPSMVGSEKRSHGAVSADSSYMSMSPGSSKGHSPTPKLVISDGNSSSGSGTGTLDRKSAKSSRSASSSKSKISGKLSAMWSSSNHGNSGHTSSSDYMMSDHSDNRLKTSSSSLSSSSSDYISLDHHSSKAGAASSSTTKPKPVQISKNLSSSSDYMNTSSSPSSSSSLSNFNAKLTDCSSDSDTLSRSSSVGNRNTKKLKVVIGKKKSTKQTTSPSNVRKKEADYITANPSKPNADYMIGNPANRQESDYIIANPGNKHESDYILTSHSKEESDYIVADVGKQENIYANASGNSQRNVKVGKPSESNKSVSDSPYINVSNPYQRISDQTIKNNPTKDGNLPVVSADSYMIVSSAASVSDTSVQTIQLDKVKSPIRSEPLIDQGPKAKVQKCSPTSKSPTATVVKCASPKTRIPTGFKIEEEADYINVGSDLPISPLSKTCADKDVKTTPVNGSRPTVAPPADSNRLMPSNEAYLPKRRSSPSLTSYLESETTATMSVIQKPPNPGATTPLNAPSASGLLIPGHRHSLQTAAYDSSAPVFKRSLSQTSSTSVEKELNYASLDLSSSSEVSGSISSLQDKVPRSPQSVKSRNSSGDNNDDSQGLEYAEIDFQKCRALRRSSSGLREDRFDFINQD